jgi:hypothetical protein
MEQVSEAEVSAAHE